MSVHDADKKAAYYRANRERILANVKARYAAKREEVRAYKREYQHKNSAVLAAKKKTDYAVKRESILTKQRAAYASDPSRWKANAKAYALANPEKVKAIGAAYRKSKAEPLAAQRASYYAANRARLNAISKAYYARNALKLVPYKRAAEKAWRLANPDKHREKEARRRALKRGAEVSKVDLQIILRESGGVCGICRQALDLFGIDFDHIIPLARGGTHTADNIQATHARCNRRKGAKLQTEMAS